MQFSDCALFTALSMESMFHIASLRVQCIFSLMLVLFLLFNSNECDIRDISALFSLFAFFFLLSPCISFIVRPVRAFVCAMCVQQNHNLAYTIMSVECTCNMKISIHLYLYCTCILFALYGIHKQFLFRALFKLGTGTQREREGERDCALMMIICSKCSIYAKIIMNVNMEFKQQKTSTDRFLASAQNSCHNSVDEKI